MRVPIKFNSKLLPKLFSKYIPAIRDPRDLLNTNIELSFFEECISSFKIGGTWKSTKKGRHFETNLIIGNLINEYTNPNIIEIGISSGSTTLDLISQIDGKFNLYYATDIYFQIPYQTINNLVFFYHPISHKCIMRVSDHFVIYNDLMGAIFPLNIFAQYYFNKAPHYKPSSARMLNLIHPNLLKSQKSNAKIHIVEYDIFSTWPHEKANIIKVANLLNREYFSDKCIKAAIHNLTNALQPEGRLIITDNRSTENVSIFRKDFNGTLFLERKINLGAEISNIVM